MEICRVDEILSVLAQQNSMGLEEFLMNSKSGVFGMELNCKRLDSGG